MSRYPKSTRGPIVLRAAYGMGAAARRCVDVLTAPYYAIARLFRSDRRRSRRARGEHIDNEAARMAADEGFDALAQALSDPDALVRLKALGVICELSGARAARLLSGMLHDPDPRVRMAAADSAAQLQSFGTVFSLILALEDPIEDVRHAAAQAIETITGRRVPIDVGGTDTSVSEVIAELKRWWKDQRYAQLATESKMRAAS